MRIFGSPLEVPGIAFRFGSRCARRERWAQVQGLAGPEAILERRYEDRGRYKGSQTARPSRVGNPPAPDLAQVLWVAIGKVVAEPETGAP